MFTEDEAKTKWCPFARVAELAEKAAVANYNRCVVRNMVPQNLTVYDMDTGVPTNAREKQLMVMEVNRFAPESANCLGSACMAWRKGQGGMGYCGLAGSSMHSQD